MKITDAVYSLIKIFKMLLVVHIKGVCSLEL